MLELFRINVTNCLEIFCKTAALQCFQFWEKYFIPRERLSSPHFYQVAIGFLVEQLNGEFCTDAVILDLKPRFCMLLNFYCRIFLKNLPFFEYMILFGVQNLLNMCAAICGTEIEWWKKDWKS